MDFPVELAAVTIEPPDSSTSDSNAAGSAGYGSPSFVPKEAIVCYYA
jgi:hypothetical protein